SGLSWGYGCDAFEYFRYVDAGTYSVQLLHGRGELADARFDHDRERHLHRSRNRHADAVRRRSALLAVVRTAVPPAVGPVEHHPIAELIVAELNRVARRLRLLAPLAVVAGIAEVDHLRVCARRLQVDRVAGGRPRALFPLDDRDRAVRWVRLDQRDLRVAV